MIISTITVSNIAFTPSNFGELSVQLTNNLHYANMPRLHFLSIEIFQSKNCGYLLMEVLYQVSCRQFK